MEDLIVSKEELIELFEDERIKDTGKNWVFDDNIIELVALHDIEPKYLQDVANAKFYKIIFKGKDNVALSVLWEKNSHE